MVIAYCCGCHGRFSNVNNVAIGGILAECSGGSLPDVQPPCRGGKACLLRAVQPVVADNQEYSKTYDPRSQIGSITIL